MKAKKIIGKLLLAFVLVSVGFAIGKETTRSHMPAQAEAAPVAAPGEDKIIVYYMHASFRCVTCNMVESMGEEIVRTEFGDAVKAGRLDRVMELANNRDEFMAYVRGGIREVLEGKA